MVETNPSLRERLLASETWESPARDKYEKALNDLVTRKLTPIQRWSFMLVAIALTGFTVLLVWLVIAGPKLPLLVRAILVEGAVLQIVAVGYLIYVLRRGVFHRRRQPIFLSGLMWVFGVLLAIHFVALIPTLSDTNLAVSFLGIALFTLIATGLQLIRTCIEQSELNTHERLLELTYRLLDSGRDAESEPTERSP